MKIRDLVVMLNVSQGQIVRALNEDKMARYRGDAYVLVSRYNMDQWLTEMRNAEQILRNIGPTDA